MGQDVSGYRLASKSHVIEAVAICPQGLLNSAQSFAKRELGESYGEELVATAESLAVLIAVIFCHATVKRFAWEEIHNLGKDDSPFAHGVLRTGKRSL
jgi:hypothetical protein